MHHTQGVWGSGVFAPGMFAFAQQPGKQAKTGKPRRSRSINKEMAAAPGRNPCWVFVKQFSRSDMATACQDWLRVPS